MRRLLILVVIALLGVAPFAGVSFAAQEVGGGDWADVAQPTLGAPLSLLGKLQRTLKSEFPDQATFVDEARSSLATRNKIANSGYVVSFLQRLAHVPDIATAEWMAVYVRSGEFVLDNMGPDPFFVVPGDARESIQKFEVNHTDGTVFRYTLDGNFACAGVCSVTPPMAVQVLENDWIIAPSKELCVWCLLNQNASSGQSTGILYVYPLFTTDEEFSWIQSWNNFQAAAEVAATPPSLHSGGSDQEPMTGVVGWAMFNPAGNCRSP
jgi:hypothetical protein